MCPIFSFLQEKTKNILRRFSYCYLSSRSTPESLAVRCSTPLKTWGERDDEICWGLFDRNGVSTISLYFIREASYRRGASIRVDGMPKGPHQPNVIWMSLLCLTSIRKAIKLLVITQHMIIFSRVQVLLRKLCLSGLQVAHWRLRKPLWEVLSDSFWYFVLIFSCPSSSLPTYGTE